MFRIGTLGISLNQNDKDALKKMVLKKEKEDIFAFLLTEEGCN